MTLLEQESAIAAQCYKVQPWLRFGIDVEALVVFGQGSGLGRFIVVYIGGRSVAANQFMNEAAFKRTLKALDCPEPDEIAQFVFVGDIENEPA